MRYINRTIVRNTHENYAFEDPDPDGSFIPIDHYTTPVMKYPSVADISTLTVRTELWKVGDRLYKYADNYYNDPSKWWIIAWYNQKPTEAHFNLGDVVYIPTPLSQVMKLYGY
jgi:hypothetical protein